MESVIFHVPNEYFSSNFTYTIRQTIFLPLLDMYKYPRTKKYNTHGLTCNHAYNDTPLYNDQPRFHSVFRVEIDCSVQSTRNNRNIVRYVYRICPQCARVELHTVCRTLSNGTRTCHILPRTKSRTKIKSYMLM